MAGPLLVVDTPSMLFRAFYALPKTIVGADGKPVNALLGSANLILREVELHEPRAVVLCFGPDAASYRTELYPAYHAERARGARPAARRSGPTAATSSRPSAGRSAPARTSRPTTCSAPTPSARPRPAGGR